MGYSDSLLFDPARDQLLEVAGSPANATITRDPSVSTSTTPEDHTMTTNTKIDGSIELRRGFPLFYFNRYQHPARSGGAHHTVEVGVPLLHVTLSLWRR